MEEPARCYNCGHPISGKFCSECGQKFQPPVTPLRDVVLDMLGNFVTFDSKGLRSLVPLITRPGFLTKEYAAGRQVAYLAPSRLYALVSVYFWLLVRRFDPVTVDAFKGMLKESSTPRVLTATQMAQMNERISNNLPLLMLAIIPLFALLMKLLYLRQRIYYTQHLTFAFHFFAFLFLIATPAVIWHKPHLYDVLFFGVVPLYLFLALRTVYGQRPGVTIAKAVVLSVGFLALFILWVILVVVTGLRA